MATTKPATVRTAPAPPPTLRAPRTSQKAAKASWMKPPTRRTRCDQAARASSAPVGAAETVMIGSLAPGTRRLSQETAVASGVPAVPKVDWYLEVSRTKGSSNS